MRRLAIAVPLAFAIAPAAAHAAEIRTDRTCYLESDRTTVQVSGTGFGAGRPYNVLLDGRPLDNGSGTADAAGAMSGAFNPPPLAATERERAFQVAVQSDEATAASTFTVTRFSAGFTPSSGDPKRLRVRFSVHGFGLGRANPDVFVHYVGPRGRLAATVRLGRAQGQCGSIARTARRRLFPFPNPAHGRWNLQFDTSRRYRRGTSRSSFLYYTVGLRVRAS